MFLFKTYLTTFVLSLQFLLLFRSLHIDAIILRNRSSFKIILSVYLQHIFVLIVMF